MAVTSARPPAKINPPNSINNPLIMKHIICIGECTLDIVFENSQPIGAMPGGRIINAAAALARAGLPAVMASEASSDPVGDMIVDFLKTAGVDISSLDRFVQGSSPLMLFSDSSDGEYNITRYENYGDGGFDIVWPRVSDQTIVVFGGYYVLDPRMRERMVPFLQNCAERHAVMIYVPGFPPQMVSRITKVMPALLDNLELADMVITRTNDLRHIFNTGNAAECYRDHIDYYCHSMLNVDTANAKLQYFSGKQSSETAITAPACGSLLWNAGAIAGATRAIFDHNVSAKDLADAGEELRQAVLAEAARMGNASADAVDETWKLHLK